MCHPERLSFPIVNVLTPQQAVSAGATVRHGLSSRRRISPGSRALKSAARERVAVRASAAQPLKINAVSISVKVSEPLVAFHQAQAEIIAPSFAHASLCSYVVLTCFTLQVIPSLTGDASTQAPPDLPSFIFKERIVYLVSGVHRRLGESEITNFCSRVKLCCRA